ncbi:MAG TPA: hypothetical protein VFG14_02820 [Chthoniobacteraceae bacterium]|nr:hypothetical protein [Chthoniobacteraceae bacterium]
MTAYNKLFAAIISTLLSRWLFSYFGLDLVEMGVAPDLQSLVSLGVDAAFAGVNGFFVWLLPNKAPTT